MAVESLVSVETLPALHPEKYLMINTDSCLFMYVRQPFGNNAADVARYTNTVVASVVIVVVMVGTVVMQFCVILYSEG